jgi:uncharacterized protein
VPALRVVLDPDVLLCGLVYPGSVPGKLVAAWRHGALDVVLPKLAHRHRLAADEIDDLIDALALQADLVESQATGEPALADANDQPVLGTLTAALQTGQADALITGDKALLALRDRYPIRTPAEFWAAHGGL